MYGAGVLGPATINEPWRLAEAMTPETLAPSVPAGTPAFALADMAVVALYMLVMVAIGWWASHGQKSTRDYFLGGRSISWWAVGLAIIATETSALTFIGVPAMAFGPLARNEAGEIIVKQGSIDYLQLIIGYVIARVIIAIIMVPHYFKGDVYSPYQLLLKSFGRAPRFLASIFFLVGGSLGAGVRIYVTAIPVMLIFRVFFPDWEILHSIALFTLVAILYTHVGGVKAVIWTDVFQFFIFVVGGVASLVWITSLVDGGWDRIVQIGTETDRWTWYRTGLVSREDFTKSGGEGFWPFLWANIQEIIGGRFNLWMGFIGATIGVMCSHGVDQLNVQRVLNCRSARDGSKALILSAVLIFPLFLLFLTVGVALYAYYSLNNFAFGIDPWNPADPDRNPKADYVFPIFIVTHMPPVLKGFIISAILAAAMSSIAGALSALGSVLVMDIFKPLDRVKRSEASYLRISRWAILVAASGLMIIAYFSQTTPLVFNLAFELAGLTSGALLGSVLFAIYKKRCYPGPILAGMIASFVVMIVVVLLTKFGAIRINWPWFTPLGTAVTLAVAYLAAIGVPKPEHDFADVEPIHK
jgi:SSS family transporter